MMTTVQCGETLKNNVCGSQSLRRGYGDSGPRAAVSGFITALTDQAEEEEGLVGRQTNEMKK